MSPALRIGLVGCGRIASVGYVPAIAATGAVELIALADPCEQRGRDLAARVANGTVPSWHPDARSLLESAPVEALVVASPVDQHSDAARHAAAAGLPCLVEKPPGPDLAAARELAELDPAPWVGFNRRFHQGAKLAAAVPASGPLELELELRYRRTSWDAHSVRDDVLLDLGTHLVDLALSLSGGAPAEVRSARAEPERAEIELETARGPALIRCASDRPHLERVVASWPGRRAASVTGGLVRGTVGRLTGRPHPLVGSLSRQLDAFAAAARGGDPGPLASAGEGAATMAVIDAARALAA